MWVGAAVLSAKTGYLQKDLGHADGQEGFGKPESHSGSRRSTIPRGATDRRRKKRACLAWAGKKPLVKRLLNL